MATTVVAKTLDLTPVPVNICITRGDDRPFSFRMLESDGVTPRDLSTLGAITLTVNTSKSPVGAVPPATFALVGVVAGEVITFTPTAGQMDLTPAKYFFDVSTTTPLFTEIKGEFVVSQDIGK